MKNEPGLRPDDQFPRGRVFDRRVQFDDRSRQFPVRAVLSPRQQKIPRSFTWACDVTLDQGHEGACVGFAWSHELRSRPHVVNGITDQSAREIYRQARKIDEWPGEDYEGTSVLAGAKVCKRLGFTHEYRWAFGLQDLILAIGYAGPAVLGLNWYEGMMDTNSTGFIVPTGDLFGGHAILCRAVSVKAKRFLLHNSWGNGWGVRGCAWITFDHLERLLYEQGEACVPVIRGNKPAPKG